MIAFLLPTLAAVSDVPIPARAAAAAAEQLCLAGGNDFAKTGERARQAGWTDGLANARRDVPELADTPQVKRSADGKLSLITGIALTGLKQPHMACEVSTRSASKEEMIAAVSERLGVPDPGAVSVWTKSGEPLRKVTVISYPSRSEYAIAVVQFGHWNKDTGKAVWRSIDK